MRGGGGRTGKKRELGGGGRESMRGERERERDGNCRIAS